jgi:Protein of unknown function (DUF1186)/SEC-C motif
MLTIDQIISDLNVADDSYFPRTALEDAIAQQEAITPVLLDIIKGIANDPESLEDSPAFIYSIYLLAQFRERRAYPIIVQYFGQLGLEDEALDPTGDTVTEDLDSILASVCLGDLGLIKQLIEDPEVNEYVQSAALGSLVILYNVDKLSREELISYLKTYLYRCIEEDCDPLVIAILAIICCYIHPAELYEQLTHCFDQGLCDTQMIHQADFNRHMQMDIDAVLAELKANSRFRLINNVISEMEWWACFHPETNSTKALHVSQTGNAKIGRNDPCPCDSGKKYKKCCLD